MFHIVICFKVRYNIGEISKHVEEKTMIFKREDKINGIVYAYTPQKRFDMVRDLGVDWIRWNIQFPWEDKIGGKVTERWKKDKAFIEEATAAGLHVMPSTPTIFKFLPEICGQYGTQEYYDNVRRAANFMAEDLGSLAPSLWQCMNEMDIATFSGSMPTEVSVETCRQTARGILDVNPDAVCGTNFAFWSPRARQIGEMLFKGDHPFRYVGEDQYFGSWHPGTVDDWPATLDEIWDAFGMPILVNEWGYSSRGEVMDPEIHKGAVCKYHAWCYEMPGGHNEEVQADYFRRGLEIFADHPHVMGNFMFCFSDGKTCWHCHTEGCPAECFWGLCDYECNPKPAYYTVKEIISKLYR